MDDFLNELYEVIADEEAEELGIDINNEHYKILDDSQANFFLRRLAELKEENNKINEMCDAEINSFIEKVNKFRENKLKANDGTIEYFTALLERYAINELANTNKKSLKLPFGTLQFRTSPEKFNYVDSDIVLKLLENNNFNELIRTKKEIDKTNLKKAVSIRDGKAFIEDIEIEGLEIEPSQTSFSIKV